MSERDRSTIEGPIAADWWLLASALQALLFHDEYRDRDEHRAPTTPTYVSGPDQDGYHFTLRRRTPDNVMIIGPLLGDIYLIRGDGVTTVRMLVAPEIQVYCYGLFQALELLANGAHDFKRRFEPSVEQAIERYYRSRAAGSRITLRQIALDTGFSYGYLRTAKIAYDKAGKFGSKKRLSSGDNMKYTV